MRFFFIFRTVDVAIQKGFLRYTVSAFKDPLLAISNLFTPLPFCKEFLNIITEADSGQNTFPPSRQLTRC